MRSRFIAAGMMAAVLLCSGGCGSKKNDQAGGTDPVGAGQGDKSRVAQDLLGGLDRTTVEKTRSNMKTIHTALTSYSTDRGGYPIGGDIQAVSAALTPTYIRVFPYKDEWGLSFVYNSPDGNTYTLTSLGIDGTKGTKDDIEMTDGAFTKLPDGYRDLIQ